MTMNFDISKLELRFALDMHYALFTDRDSSDNSSLGQFNSDFLSSVDYLIYNILLYFAREVMHLIVLRYEDGRHHFLDCSGNDIPFDEPIRSHEVHPFDDITRRF